MTQCENANCGKGNSHEKHEKSQKREVQVPASLSDFSCLFVAIPAMELTVLRSNSSFKSVFLKDVWLGSSAASPQEFDVLGADFVRPQPPLTRNLERLSDVSSHPVPAKRGVLSGASANWW